jgi:hypothetical protein
MGLLDNIGAFLSDEENQLNLASGFNNMSGNPNAGNIQAGINQRLKGIGDNRRLKAAQDLATSQATGQRNRTVEMLIGKGGKYAELGRQLKNQQISPTEAMAFAKKLYADEIAQGNKEPSVTYSMLPFAEVMARGLDPSIPHQISSNGKVMPVNSGSSGPNIDITNNAAPGPADVGTNDFFKKLQTGAATSINTTADTYTAAREGMNQVETLIQLGAVMDDQVSVPAWARDMIPEGISTSVDAYRSIAYGVAQSMRVKGSGPMTDKDFNILVSRAGSASMDSDARQVIQSGLRQAAQRKLDMANAADDFRLNPTEEAKNIYAEKVKEIKNRPLFSAEQRAYLESLSPAKDPGDLTTNARTYFDTLPKSRQTSFLLMSPERQQAFSDAWIKEQTE